MSTIKGSAHYTGLLPAIRPTTLESDWFQNRKPSLRKRASRALSRFLIAFCTGVAATLAWWSYGDAARQMIANYYPQLGWLAPKAEPVAQSAPDMIVLAPPAAPSFDQQQLSAMSLNLDAVRQSIDRIVAGQEQMTRSVDQIAASIAAGQEQTTRSIDQIASSIAASQGQMARSTDQTASSIATGPELMTDSIGEVATRIAQFLSAEAGGITVESRADGVSLQPTNIKPAEARPPQILSERGKQLSTTSGHHPSCFPLAWAVVQNRPGGWPSWTLQSARLRGR